MTRLIDKKRGRLFERESAHELVQQLAKLHFNDAFNSRNVTVTIVPYSAVGNHCDPNPNNPETPVPSNAPSTAPAEAATTALNGGGSTAPAISMVGQLLTIECGQQSRQVVPAQLQSEEYRSQLIDELCRAGDLLVFDLSQLLNWSDAERWSVLAFIAGLNCSYEARVGDVEYEDLFSGVLSAMTGSGNVGRCGRGVLAAIETAAMMHPHPHEWPAACERILERLKELSVKSYTRGQLKKLLEQQVANSQDVADEEQSDLIVVHETLPDAPVPSDSIVPEDWMLSHEGIAKGSGEDAVVTIPAPIVITRRFTDVDDKAEHLGVAWFRDGQWQQQIVSRSTIVDKRAVLQLAAFGAPVNSNNAGQVVDYLVAFETHNLEILPRAMVTKQLGWQGTEGQQSFLWGNTLIRNETPTAGNMTAEQTAADRSEIIFRGADEGDNQLADGYRSAGSLESWQATLSPLGGFPRVMFTVYAALTTPLLRIFGAQNFTVSLSGATSQGKTITQRVAASCWGCPDERSAGAVVSTWDATRVYIERACGAQNDLPLLLDDTKRARADKDIAQTLYDVSAGRGRGRGSLDGIRGVETFRTVMISSGEAPITSYSQDGGTRPRVLELWGSPFGRADAQTAQVVSDINEGVLENFGHAGPLFVQFLINNQEQWPAWQERYRSIRDGYVQRAGNNSVAARMGAHVAAISMAAILVHQAIDMPWEHRDVVAELWPEMTAEAPEADRAAVALRHALSWAHGHREQFFGAASPTAKTTGAPWAGYWNVGSGTGTDWKFLGFLPDVIDRVLCDGGFEPEPIRRLWRDREWLKLSKGKPMYRQRMGNMNTYLVAIKREIIEQFEEPDTADSDGRPFPNV